MKGKSRATLIALVLLLCTIFTSGCIKFYDYKHCKIKVIDPELNKPVKNAVISLVYDDIHYIDGWLLRPPAQMNVKTNRSGLARIKIAANCMPYSPVCSVKTEGYITHPLIFMSRVKIVNPLCYDMVPIRHQIGEKAEITVPIYRNPAPKMNIVVPDGYKGPVAIEFLKSNESDQFEPGKRYFSYKTDHKGRLVVKTHPLFKHLGLPGGRDCPTSFKYENGNNIPFNYRYGKEEKDQIQIEWIWIHKLKLLYVIGNAKQRLAFRSKIMEGRYEPKDIRAFNAYFKKNNPVILSKKKNKQDKQEL